MIFLGQGSVENLKTFRDGAGRLGHSFYMGPGLGQDVQFFLKVSYLVLEMMINGMLRGTKIINMTCATQYRLICSFLPDFVTGDGRSSLQTERSNAHQRFGQLPGPDGSGT